MAYISRLFARLMASLAALPVGTVVSDFNPVTLDCSKDYLRLRGRRTQKSQAKPLYTKQPAADVIEHNQAVEAARLEKRAVAYATDLLKTSRFQSATKGVIKRKHPNWKGVRKAVKACGLSQTQGIKLRQMLAQG